MRKVIEEKTVYLFSELSEEAKEKVRNWYLESQDTYIFSEDCEEELREIFPNSGLDVQYSLSYCQGDGFNIFGNLDIDDFIVYSGEHLEEVCDANCWEFLEDGSIY